MPANQGPTATGFTPVWRQSAAPFSSTGNVLAANPPGLWTSDESVAYAPYPLLVVRSRAVVPEEEAPTGTAWEQPVDDTLSVTDATSFDRGLTAADTVAVADALSSAGVFARAVDDALVLADALAFARDWHIADALTVADSPVTAAGKGASIDDTVSLADALNSQAVIQRTVADTLTLADALALQAAFLRSVADTLTLGDLASPVKTAGGVDWAQPVADTLTLADTVRFARGLGLPDTLAVADTLVFQAAYLRTLADLVTVLDQVDPRLRPAAAVLNLADAIYLGDQAADKVYAGSTQVWP